jgi:hypothetical protein
MKKAVFLLLLTLCNVTQAQPDYGKVIVDGFEKGLIMPFSSAKKIITNEGEGSGKIETKDGKVKIDTKNAESMKKADEFRRNYKKSSECLEPENEEIRIKCVNEYIHARKKAIN